MGSGLIYDDDGNDITMSVADEIASDKHAFDGETWDETEGMSWDEIDASVMSADNINAQINIKKNKEDSETSDE